MTTMWGNNDVASNSVIWAPLQFGQSPTRANANLMYGNTTLGALKANETISLVHIGNDEMNQSTYKVTAAVANASGFGTGYVPGDVLTVANTPATGANVQVQANLDVLTTQVATLTLAGVGTGGSYVAGEQLFLANGVATTNASATISSTKIRTVAAVAASGSGYANGDTVRPADGTATTNAVFTVTTGASNSSIASLALTTNGVYTTNPSNLATCNLTAITGSGVNGQATITMRINALGTLTGGAYTTNPTLNNSTTSVLSTGTGAVVNVVMGIGTLGVNNAGLYLSQTVLLGASLTGGSGSGAAGDLTEPLTQDEGKIAGMTGWAVRTQGTGGRAGRVQYEVLVAGVGGDLTSANNTFLG